MSGDLIGVEKENIQNIQGQDSWSQAYVSTKIKTKLSLYLGIDK